MNKTTPLEALQESILALKTKQDNEEAMLLAQFTNPINLIKSGIDEFVNNPNLKENVVNTSVSLAVGYITKKVVVGKSKSHIKHFLGNLLQVGITYIISKNADKIKIFALRKMTNLLGKER